MANKDIVAKKVTLSFDVGTKNLAYCLIRDEDEHIIDWNVMDISAATYDRQCQRMIDALDLIENAKILSALKVDQIKIHSLYILKNTTMGNQYLNNEFEVISVEAYVEKVVTFLRYCSPNIVFQRLVGRAPKDETLFCNWDMSWWRIKDLIDDKFEKEDYNQGDLCNYLNGRAVQVFKVE